MSDFTYTADDGTTINLPSLNTIKAGTFRKHRKLGEVDFVFTVLEEVVSPDELAKVDNLGFGEIEKMFGDWQKSAGANAGESSGSSS